MTRAAHVYLSPGKYCLAVLEEKRTDLLKFEGKWEAHMKPHRLCASSEHTKALRWISLASLLQGGCMVRTVDGTEVKASSFVRDCVPALSKWFEKRFGFVNRPSLRNMSVVEDEEQKDAVLVHLRAVLGMTGPFPPYCCISPHPRRLHPSFDSSRANPLHFK